jgi:hypothetical protein
MRVTFTLDKGSVTADLDPRMVGDLHDLLSRNAVSQSEVYSLLRNIAYFEVHREEIIDRFPGLTIVLAGEEITFAGTEDEAFSWVSESPWAAPVYIVNLQRPDEMGVAARQVSLASA